MVKYIQFIKNLNYLKAELDIRKTKKVRVMKISSLNKFFYLKYIKQTLKRSKNEGNKKLYI